MQSLEYMKNGFLLFQMTLITLIVCSAPVFAQDALRYADENFQTARQEADAAYQRLRSNPSDAGAKTDLDAAISRLNKAKVILTALQNGGGTVLAGPDSSSGAKSGDGSGASSGNTMGGTAGGKPSGTGDGTPVVMNNPADDSTDSAGSASTMTAGSPASTTASTAQKTLVDCTQREDLFAQRVCDLAEEVADEATPRVDPGSNRGRLLAIIYGQIIKGKALSVDEATRRFILDAEEARTDKQIGADANAKGTTSIVVKGGVPRVFNFAAENGGATRTINGTTVTFRFNPVGLFETLGRRDYISSFTDGFSLTDIQSSNDRQAAVKELVLGTFENSKPTDLNRFTFNDKWSNYLRKFAIGISFDTSRGDLDTVLSGSSRQVSALSFRYEFINKRDPRHPRYREAWRNIYDDEGARLIETLTAEWAKEVFTRVNRQYTFADPDLRAWFDALNVALSHVTPHDREQIEATIKTQLELLPADKLAANQGLLGAFGRITKAFVDFHSREKELLNEIARAPVFTVEYTNQREVNIPDTHNFNVIFAKGVPLSSAKDAWVMDLTFNGAFSWYGKRPIDAAPQTIRDFSFAGQADVPLGGMDPRARFYGMTFSFAAKYQRLQGDAVAFDGTIFPETKGDIFLGQAKLMIPLDSFGLTGIKLPISATYSNRNELVRESKVRGNFGITFDMDKLILCRFMDCSSRP